jgi:hypothetical protein
MKFATDHFFHIGHTHYQSGKPCQDYATSACERGSSMRGEDRAIAVVADGCSTGGQTDVGSRALALGTLKSLREQAIRPEQTLADFLGYVRWRQKVCAEGVQYGLGLKHQDLLSTCVFACITPHRGFVQVLGDGVVAWKRKNGTVEMVRFEWAKNAPFYAAYKWKLNGLEDFVAFHGGDPNAPAVTATHAVVHPNGIAYFDDLTKTLHQGTSGELSWQWDHEFLSDIDCVAVFTDGVTQIDNVSWEKAVVQLLSFKSTAGEFAKRRMMAEIRNTQKVGKGPLDDISYSVIHILRDEDLPAVADLSAEGSK